MGERSGLSRRVQNDIIDTKNNLKCVVFTPLLRTLPESIRPRPENLCGGHGGGVTRLRGGGM